MSLYAKRLERGRFIWPCRNRNGAGRGRRAIRGGAILLRDLQPQDQSVDPGEKCNRYKRILASSVPKLPQLRPVIVRWSTLFRPRFAA